MRAIQRTIVGVGLALVVAMALLVGNPGSLGPEPSSQPAKQATSPRIPLIDVPTSPPAPVEAAEDTSVGTLPPPPDASLATHLTSRDLVAPSDSAPNTRSMADGKGPGARKARAAEKPETSGRPPATPEQDFTVTQDGWAWSEWDDDPDRYTDGDRDDCQHGRYDHRYDCDDRDWRDWRD